jgi:endoglucanase
VNHLRLLLVLLCLGTAAAAQLGTASNNIRIDQFGYYPASRKVAVIAKPISGFNVTSEGAYDPSTGANAFQVLRWSDNAVVYSGTLTAWNGGATHSQSGDKGWWFDFTSVTTPGSYYLYDAANNVRSYRFVIGSTVYDDALKEALRTFFYQRINGAKQTPYADSRWADGAAFGGTNQDYSARSLSNTDPKDLSGGWMDAGDYNKYTTFAADALLPLLDSYRSYPAVFGDNNNIPESGNGVPDLLDEVKWELDWYKRMQDATGTNRGLFLKVGVTTWNSATPPSTDANPRYYVGECTSATISGAAVFALASIVYRSLGGSYVVYADDLLDRAKDAWTRAAAVTSTFTANFETTCDDQTIKAGDADASVKDQKNMAFTAAVYLYEATGNATYKSFIESRYTTTYPYTDSYWGPYYTAVQKALLRYAALPTTATAGSAYADATIASAIRTYKASQNHILGLDNYNNGSDLYRAYMPDTDYAWGSNRTKCYAALHNYDFVTFNINSSNATGYKEAGESYLHYLHGVNALGKVMLVNMYAAGGDNCANEMSHAWFRDGTAWDNALTSTYGPAPGYMTGGPNQYYWVSSITPPYGQLPQKAYKDWNTDWNNATSTDEASYSITEPSISNQAAYVSALARVIATSSTSVLPVDFIYFTAVPGNSGAFLQWRVSDTEDLQYFVVERSFDGRSFSPLVVVNSRAAQLVYTYTDAEVAGNSRSAWYRIKAVERGRTALSAVRQLKSAGINVSVTPNPAGSTAWLTGRMATAGALSIRVVNTEGAVVISEKKSSAAGAFSYPLQLAGLPAGMYWVRVGTAGSEENIALLKRD